MNSDNMFIKSAVYIINVILDIFYPKKCIICNSFINIGKTICICKTCKSQLDKQGKVVRDNEKYFEEAVCALEYSNYVKDAMTDYKFKSIRYFSKTFAYAIYNKIKQREFIKEISFVCPVPIHPYRNREYNQSELVADYISQYTGIPSIADALIKIKHITPLSKRDRVMRRHSIRSAITLNLKYNIMGKTVCLIDDIYTTGSTSNECARILKMYGATKVYVLSACYAPDKLKGGKHNADADIIN